MHIWIKARPARILVAGVSLLAAGIILATLLYRERAVLLTYDWQLRWGYLGLGFGLLLLGLVLAALVWASIMRTLGSGVTHSDHLRYYVISHLARRLPGTVWYVASRGYLYRQHGESVPFIALASALELLITTVSGALVTLFFGAISTTLSTLQMLGLLATVVVGGLATHPALVRWGLRRLGQANAPLPPYRAILQWLGAYLLIWVLGGLILYCIANAVTNVDLRTAPYIIGSWSLVGVLAVTVFFLPSNLGLTEVGLSLLLATLMPSSIAVLIAVLARIAIIVYELLGAWLILAILRFSKTSPKRPLPSA